MPDEKRVIREILKDVQRIHSFVHPHAEQSVYQARSFREDAVRMTVLQVSLRIEALLDGLFRRAFLGYKPQLFKRGEKRKREPTHVKELDELLTGGRFGFESKLRLASILGLTTKSENKRLDKLRALRNKCAHSWGLDIIRKRGRKPRPTRRLLEFEGRNLFDLKVLENFMQIYHGIYLELLNRYLFLPPHYFARQKSE
jgi:hypothetical protein